MFLVRFGGMARVMWRCVLRSSSQAYFTLTVLDFMLSLYDDIDRSDTFMTLATLCLQ